MTDAERSSMRVEAIVDLVNRTREIDRSDMGFVVKVQDMLNVSQDEAEKVVAILGKEMMGRLMWIVTTVCGFDTFKFWMEYGYLNGYKQRIIRQLAAEYQEGFEENCSRATALDKRERLLGQREQKLEENESMLEQEVGKRVGEQVRILRYRVQALEERLECETAKNRRAKAILRLAGAGA